MERLNPVHLRKKAPQTASKELPAAIASDTEGGAPNDQFAKKAASAIAGQNRVPQIKSAARAIPLGGQTSVAKPFTAPSFKPSLAVMK